MEENDMEVTYLFLDVFLEFYVEMEILGGVVLEFVEL